MMTAAEKVVSHARQEEGYLEKATKAQLDDKTANAGSGNWTKYARDLDALGVYNGKKNGYAWCDVFVDWNMIQTFGLELAMQMTFQPMGGYGAGCTSSAAYYRKAGRFFSTPQVGDQIFFSKDNGKTMYHTGLVTKVTGTKVHTIEGNTSSLPGVVENGGCVREKSYNLSYDKIGGYGRPDYSLVKEDDIVTQAEWDAMMADWLARKANEPPAEWSREAREWAESNNIIAGDVSGKKMYRAFPTREQMIVFLHRLVKELGL